MSDIDTIRTAIAATMRAVSGVGLVHDRERYAHAQADLKRLYVQGETLHGWYVRRVSTQETTGAIGRSEVIHRWRLRGFLGFDDAAGSELAFDREIEALRDAFRADETLGGAVITTVADEGDGAIAGLQVEDSGPVMFAGILCHAATLGLYTRHYL